MDLDALIALRKARKAWRSAERRAKALGHSSGVSPESLRLYNTYQDCYLTALESSSIPPTNFLPNYR